MRTRGRAIIDGELHLRQGDGHPRIRRTILSTSTTTMAFRPTIARTSSTPPTRTNSAGLSTEQVRRRHRERLAGFRHHADPERRESHWPARAELRHEPERLQGSGDHPQRQLNFVVRHAEYHADADPDLRSDAEPRAASSTSTQAASASPQRWRERGATMLPVVYGPAFFNSDLGLFKNFTITEGKQLQFRANAYNFLNHPLWSFPANQNLTLGFNGTTGATEHAAIRNDDHKAGQAHHPVRRDVQFLTVLRSLHILLLLICGAASAQTRRYRRDSQAGDWPASGRATLRPRFRRMKSISRSGRTLRWRCRISARRMRKRWPLQRRDRAIQPRAQTPARESVARVESGACVLQDRSDGSALLRSLRRFIAPLPVRSSLCCCSPTPGWRWASTRKWIALLTPVHEKSPDDLAITYMLGTALVRGGQVARGQVIIDRILRNGDSAEARLLLGVTKLNAHDYPAALADLAKAVELNPNLPDVYAYLWAGAAGDRRSWPAQLTPIARRSPRIRTTSRRTWNSAFCSRMSTNSTKLSNACAARCRRAG